MVKFVRNNLPALIIAAFLSFVFFPVAASLARFSGNLELVAIFLARSPSLLVSFEEVERSRFEADAHKELQLAKQKVIAGRLQLCLSPRLDAEEWKNMAIRTIDELSRLLPGKPPLPQIETRRLFNANGCMDNFFSLAVNHHGDEPLRTMSHELTHLFLLWAMIPGMPVDCPRWLNEGLAEHVSGRLAGDADGWEKNALIGSRQFIPLHVISPAFSWPDFQVEWPARTATALLLEKFGEDGFRQMPVWSEYLLIFVFLFLFFKLIFRLRKLLLPKLKMAWSGDMQINLLFRWLVIGATGLVGAWFIRFLIIAMIPYSGIAALTALQRIMLAELLVIFLWLGLSWQMKRWESDKCATAALCTDWRSKKNLKLLFWLLFISSIPVFAAITDNGRLGCDIPVSQMILGIFILLAGGWAFSRAIWRWTAAWMTGSSAVAHLGPAFIYALFRGGLAPDPWASLFALAAGFQISRLVAAQKSPTVGFIADIALTFPALIMVIGWFPAVDPIVGVWNIDSAPSMWWLVPTLLLFLMRMQKEVANQPNQL